MPAAQNLRDQRFARTVDREVAPIWHNRFSRIAWRHLPDLTEGLVLDVHSGPGHTTTELLERMDPTNRIVALEPSAAMRDLAKARIPAESKARVYFKPGDFSDIGDMADDTYDLVLCNLVLSEAQDVEEALADLVRITKPGGTVLATVPMEGSWTEAEDLFREVLREAGMDHAIARLRRLAHLRPTGHEIARVAQALGVGHEGFVVEQERFTLLFNSGREFLFSSLVEYGPLRLWKAIVGDHPNPQEVFFRFKALIDAYFSVSVFSVTAVAGVLRLQVPPTATGALAQGQRAVIASKYWSQFAGLDAMFRARENFDEAGESDLALDIEIEDDGPAVPAAAAPPSAASEAIPAAVLEDEDTAPRQLAPTASDAAMAAEDEAIFALLDQHSHTVEPDADLDALLDQVLEFAGGDETESRQPPGIEEIAAADLIEVAPGDVKKPGETLKRIKALLPPPPSVPPPPPPPGKTRKRRR